MSWRSRSYDELPALSVRGPELRHSLRTVTIAWMYGVVWLACISSGHVPVFGRLIGFNTFHFGLMAAIPFFATLSQLFAALLIERTGLRKYQFMHFATAHRLMWIPIAMVPLLLPTPSQWSVLLVLILLTCSWFAESLARPAWVTWMGDLIPRRIRGRFFARRGRVTQGVMIVTVIVLGLMMDHNWKIWSFLDSHLNLPFVHTRADASPGGAKLQMFREVTSGEDRGQGLRTFRANDSQRTVSIKASDLAGSPTDAWLLEAMNKSRLLLWTICGVFILAALFGARDILLFRRVREVLPPIHRGDEHTRPHVPLRRELREMLIEPLKDRVFRHYVSYASILTFSTCIGAMYFWIQAMQKLGFSQLATNLLFLVIGPLADMASSPIWGRLIDRWGRRPILMIATAGTLLSVVPWLIAAPDTPHPAFVEHGLNWLSATVGSWLGHGDWRIVTPGMPVGAYLLAMCGCVIGGTCWSGAMLAQLGVMLHFSDGKGRSRSVAVSGVLISMGGMLGGLAGGAITYALKDMAPFGPLMWNNMQVVFFVALVIRTAAIGFLVGMPDPGAKPVRALLAHVRVNVFNAVQSRMFYPLRIFGWGRETSRNHDKQH